jgi:lipopolysaccharide export system permease protein
MGLLKLADTGQVIAPFIVLFATLLTFWRLSRQREIVVLKSAGFSSWQFLSSILLTGLGLGILFTTAVNPLGARLIERFERMEADYLSRSSNEIALFSDGIWLRQGHDDGYLILHARNIKRPEWQMRNVMAIFFDDQHRFIKRYDTERAHLGEGQWRFIKPVISHPDKSSTQSETRTIKTDLTPQDIEESFSSPETISFWHLRDFIKVMERAGFDATKLRVHFHSLLAMPFMFAGMILIGALIATKPPRFQHAGKLVAGGVITGFIVFFAANFLEALGASHQIPVALAAWTAPLVTLLLGATAILSVEEA